MNTSIFRTSYYDDVCILLANNAFHFFFRVEVISSLSAPRAAVTLRRRLTERPTTNVHISHIRKRGKSGYSN